MHRVLGSLWLTIVVMGPCPVAHAQVGGDFNGDGFGDLALGVPSEDVGAVVDAGAVNVIYGSAEKLTPSQDQFWHQNILGIIDDAEEGDRFGEVLAVGDFDGDGFDDLAIGVPNENIGDVEDSGAINVLYGSSDGLRANGDQFWHQDSPGVIDVNEPQDRFGRALTVGDFNGDGYDDLVIGAPEEDNNGGFNNGAVNVLRGSPEGLTASGDQFWCASTPGLDQIQSTDDELFGRALTSGDFNGDGLDDLAIGTPGKFYQGKEFAGSVSILHGTEEGLSSAQSQFWSQDSVGILDVSETDDAFAFTLAAGDFDADGFEDLAIGTPFEEVGFWFLAGAVNVVYGSEAGLQPFRDQFWHQDAPGVQGDGGFSEFFGIALAVGDYNGDGFADLAIGVGGDNAGSVQNAGAVNVLYGSSSGLRGNGDQYWHQDSPGVMDSAEPNDGFGFSLTCGDCDGDGFADLIIGVPSESIDDIEGAGAVNVLYGSPSKLTASGDQFWSQNSPNIADGCEASDQVGFVLPN